MPAAAQPVRIIGIGNVLMGDDGVGPAAVELLRSRYELPEGVELIDAGTPGPDLSYLLRDAGTVVVLDAVRGADEVGRVRLLRREELGEAAEISVSAHDPTLVRSLALLEFTGESPADVVLVGITIAAAAPEPGLSPPVASALPELVESVAGLLRDLGYPPSPRALPSEPRPWWL